MSSEDSPQKAVLNKQDVRMRNGKNEDNPELSLAFRKKLISDSFKAYVNKVLG